MTLVLWHHLCPITSSKLVQFHDLSSIHDKLDSSPMILMFFWTMNYVFTLLYGVVMASLDYQRASIQVFHFPNLLLTLTHLSGVLFNHSFLSTVLNSTQCYHLVNVHSQIISSYLAVTFASSIVGDIYNRWSTSCLFFRNWKYPRSSCLHPPLSSTISYTWTHKCW